MGAAHANQNYVDALGYQGETLTTDANGILTVPVTGSQTVQVHGYLAAWVPKAPAKTMTTVTLGAKSITAGSTTTVTATVGAGATGTVTFTDGATTLGTATVVDGSASLTTATTLAVGRHDLVATYSGDDTHTASTSPAVQLTVTAAAAATGTGSGTAGGTGTGSGTATGVGTTSAAVGDPSPVASALAYTGSHVAPIAGFAGLLLLLGGGMLFWNRRRTRS